MSHLTNALSALKSLYISNSGLPTDYKSRAMAYDPESHTCLYCYAEQGLVYELRPISSPDSDIDLLKCPQCKHVVRAELGD